ncbi:MAG TPA: menaquinone biosynthesis decarboxylase [Bacteroidales bacterium]|nr:MAG: menaquinone biosynthesis decarboxylase [Bacteroidetes bacterium GWF2_33_38]OFY73381.1 MAG: menaquinone biosynthesis decarboxylase [Bacteroidetes bacterium RIFOXYA12_FULL_33_9]HBF88183.1 menaquinone biosynthesis decarboxylase [Bacteroidales bacterium]
MAYNSLQEYINKLDLKGELLRIKEFVNPELQITEITDRISKQKGGGKALLFENTGTKFPLLINSLGSEKRMAMALGVEKLEEIPAEIEQIVSSFSSAGDSFFDKLKVLSKLKTFSSWFPKLKNGKGVCQEVIIKNPDLTILPILKCWPFDGGRFITLPLVHTKDPKTGNRNCGMYRMQIFDKQTTGMHWHMHKTGERHYQEYKNAGIKQMPVAVALGGDPIYTFCATAPLPDNVDEYLFAGFLRKKKVELVKCITQDIEIPSDVDIVIEGFVDTEEPKFIEGPFGDHTGFYSLEDYYPKFHVTCITHRRNAVYPATIVGIPPQEDAYIAEATEKIFLPPIKISLAPEVIDMHLPVAGVAHNICVLKIHKSYPGQAIKVANSMWGAGQMMFNKIMIIVDKEIDIFNYDKLAQIIAEKVDVSKDIYFGNGPLDVLDHSSTEFAFGSKICIDATNITSNIKHENSKFDAKHYLEIVAFNSLDLYTTLMISLKENIDKKSFINKLKLDKNISQYKFIALVNEGVDINDFFTVIWQVSGNIDPKRDIYQLTNSLIVDGTIKVNDDNFFREWPNVVTSDEKTIKEIDGMWELLHIGSFIESPSLKYKPLVKNIGVKVNKTK